MRINLIELCKYATCTVDTWWMWIAAGIIVLAVVGIFTIVEGIWNEVKKIK